MRQMLLFDIDGTLLESGGASGDALVSSFRELFQVEQPARVELRGRTDRGIVYQLFEAHDIPRNDIEFNRLRQNYLSRLPLSLQNCVGRIMPRVTELLEMLHRTARFEIGLLTGNMRGAGLAKVTHFGLDHFFEWGFFGDCHARRTDLGTAVRDLALGNMQEPDLEDSTFTHKFALHGQVDLQRSVIIGDTPQDVACARSIGSQCLCVATGGYTVDELRQHRPEKVVDDFGETDELVDWFLSI